MATQPKKREDDDLTEAERRIASLRQMLVELKTSICDVEAEIDRAERRRMRR